VPIEYDIIPVTPFQQNCSLLWCTETRQAAIVDPGGDIDRIIEAVEHSGVTPQKILLTHGHIDHVGGTAEIASRLRIPVEGPQREDRFLIDQLPQQSVMFGFSQLAAFTPDRWLEDGDRVSFGRVELEVLHCPGHTPGHVVFYSRPDRLAVVGDVLFDGSIGRTDLPRGDHAMLMRSITGKLWPLGAEVTFIPGHGPLSTFGDQRQYNPFVSDAALGRGR